MHIDADTAAAIGVALNEADFLGAEYLPARRAASLTFAVLTLPDDTAPEPIDRRRQVFLTNVGRIVAALRQSTWDDLAAEPIPFASTDLLGVVTSFGGQPVYGWEFVNTDDRIFDHWGTRASLVVEPDGGSTANRLALFQSGENRHLDLWIWFEDLMIADPTGQLVTLADFTAGGQRWWDALHASDPRTQGHSIVPDSRRR